MDLTPQRGASIYAQDCRSRNQIPVPKFIGSESADNNDDDDDEVELSAICVIGEKLRSDPVLMSAISSFQLKIVFSRSVY
jgi:hypothetical protein